MALCTQSKALDIAVSTVFGFSRVWDLVSERCWVYVRDRSIFPAKKGLVLKGFVWRICCGLTVCCQHAIKLEVCTCPEAQTPSLKPESAHWNADASEKAKQNLRQHRYTPRCRAPTEAKPYKHPMNTPQHTYEGCLKRPKHFKPSK